MSKDFRGCTSVGADLYQYMPILCIASVLDELASKQKLAD